jgi:hypothetical protein
MWHSTTHGADQLFGISLCDILNTAVAVMAIANQKRALKAKTIELDNCRVVGMNIAVWWVISFAVSKHLSFSSRVAGCMACSGSVKMPTHSRNRLMKPYIFLIRNDESIL